MKIVAGATLIHYSHQVGNGEERREFVPWVSLQACNTRLATLQRLTALNEVEYQNVTQCISIATLDLIVDKLIMLFTIRGTYQLTDY